MNDDIWMVPKPGWSFHLFFALHIGLKFLRIVYQNMIFFSIFFSVWSRNINFHGIGDRHARNDGEKLRGKHPNRSSHPTSFVYIPTNALSIRQFASKMWFFTVITSNGIIFSLEIALSVKKSTNTEVPPVTRIFESPQNRQC